jgi:DUF4097 and DUF4098 domain-containing protein YvlB
MSVRQHRSPAGDVPPAVDIRNPAGSVTVEAVEGAGEVEVVVEALNALAEELLDRVDVDLSEPANPSSPLRVRIRVPERKLLRSPSFAVRISTPPGAVVRVSVGSADVALRGRLARTDVTGASGDVSADEVTDLDVRTSSGNCRAGAVRGRASIASASGDVQLGRVEGALQARTASGDVSVERAGATASIRTASGDIVVGAAAGDVVQATTSSGDVSVGVVTGLRVWLDLATASGRISSALDDEAPEADGRPDVTLRLRSMSGDLRIDRAAHAPAA